MKRASAAKSRRPASAKLESASRGGKVRQHRRGA
jgi:hypothetical protein